MKWQTNPFNNDLRADTNNCSYHIVEVKNGLCALQRRSRGVFERIGTFSGDDAMRDAKDVVKGWYDER